MAEKYLKVLVNGQEPSFIPDTKWNRSFWAKQNANLSKSRNAAQEMATLVPATEDEARFMTEPVEASKIVHSITPNSNVVNDKVDELSKLVASQQELINKLLAAQLDATSGTPSKKKDNGKNEQAGPPAKTEE